MWKWILDSRNIRAAEGNWNRNVVGHWNTCIMVQHTLWDNNGKVVDLKDDFKVSL